MSTESGLVVVDKPGGITSHDVVSRVRRLTGIRKVGHAGTLDPMATGVLVLGVGRATRLLGHLTMADKRYSATIRLGVSTTTDDADGDVVETRPTDDLSEHLVRSALADLVGEIDQVPSSVSAVKVDGRRAYARVRAGEQVDLPARRVVVHEIAVTSFDLPSLDVDVYCSSGTYVRSLARDLGAALGVGGHLTALRRTAVGPFRLAGARTLDELADSFTITPIAEAARASFPALELGDAQVADVRVGRRLEVRLDATTALFAPDGEFLALYAPHEGVAKPLAVFV